MNRYLTAEERRRIVSKRGKIKRRRRRVKLIKRLIWLTIILVIVAYGYSRVSYLNGLEKSQENTHTTEELVQDTTNNDDLDYIEAGVDATYLGYIQDLKDLAREDSRVKTILENIEEYPTDILDLLVSNEETINFAVGYLNKENYENKKITLEKPENGEIPLYQQWDSRWGYDVYGDNIIAINGCGPTCLSMVAVGLLNDTSLNPKKIAEFSEEKGYYDANGGTLWDLMRVGAKTLGLQVSELGSDKEAIKNHLKKGHPIIASMSPGDFTTSGHYIVLTGLNSKGEVIVNDPNSITRSNKTWNLDTILKQMKNLWVFSKS